uniref:Uncharacterized protein n=1 Tax=Geospiza parvula TaxID=87175 RepID=A0A8C3NK42_GEOPR
MSRGSVLGHCGNPECFPQHPVLIPRACGVAVWVLTMCRSCLAGAPAPWGTHWLGRMVLLHSSGKAGPFFHRITEKTELEGTHKDHQVPPLALHRHPNNPTLCIPESLVQMLL